MERPRVTILGGGISGLSVAYHLSKLLPSADITLLEARPRLGGVISTIRRDGYVIEEGPDSFLASKSAGLQLCTDLGLAEQLQSTITGKRARVWWDGRLLPLPEGLSGLVPARPEALAASDLFSNDGRARVAHEIDVPARLGEEDETLGSFMTRRFGHEAYRRLIEPLMAGIYAGDGDQLSLAATFPQLRALELEYGSVMRGVQAQAPTAGRAPNRSPFLAPREGMQAIVDSLAIRLSHVAVRRNCKATHVKHRRDEYVITLDTGEHMTADALVLAIPAHAGAELLNTAHSDLSTVLGSIPYASTATISVAFPLSAVPHPLDGTGYIVPRIAERPVLAVTWASSKFEHRAPEGQVLLRAFIGRYGREASLAGSDLELLDIALTEFRNVLGITAAPDTWDLSRWPRTMPQYTLGHLERVAVARKLAGDIPGLVLTGSAYGGVGVPDCIAGGELVARELAERYQPHDWRRR